MKKKMTIILAILTLGLVLAAGSAMAQQGDSEYGPGYRAGSGYGCPGGGCYGWGAGSYDRPRADWDDRSRWGRGYGSRSGQGWGRGYGRGGGYGWGRGCGRW